MISTVQPEFLPPDPYAERPPPAQPGARPAFLPPNATHPAPAEAQNNRAVASLIFGAGSLGLLVFTAGVLFFLTVPASIVAWVLANRAKRLGSARDQANVAVIIAIAGVVLGVIAGAVWIILVATGEYSTTTPVDHTQDRGLHFDVIRLVLLGS